MGQYTIFTADGRKATVEAASATDVRDSFKRQFPDMYAAGAIIRSLDSGKDTYVSEGYSTSNPERIAEIASEGYAPGEASRQGILEQTLRERPVASRVVSATRGLPVIGEGVEEAAGYIARATGGEQAQQNVLGGTRLLQKAMEERRPVEAALTQAGVGIGASLPLAAAAAPSRIAGLTPGAAIVRGGIAGAGAGGAEGAVSGFLAGEGGSQDRMRSAAERGIFGTVLGGGLGAAAPALAAGVAQASAIPARLKYGRMAEEMGVSPEGMTVLAETIGQEGGARAAAPGVPASLAETSPAFRQLTDVALVSGQGGAAEARDILTDQAARAAQTVQQTLDDTLGEPTGRLARISEIMEGSGAKRAELYDAAYSQKVPYSEKLRQMVVKRVPNDVIARANELIEIEGAPTAKISVAYKTAKGKDRVAKLPNMQQLDYITRALQDRAFSEQASPQSQKAYRNLTRELRDELDALIPKYSEARSYAAEVIGDREAVNAGYEIFRRQVSAEEVSDILSDYKTAGQKENVKAGLRKYIQDQMDRVLTPLPQLMTETDATSRKEAAEALSQIVRSKQQREKLRIVLGEEVANAMIDRLKDQIAPLEAAALGFNSATAGRGMVANRLAGAFAEGPFDALQRGEPLRAAAMVPGQLAGYGGETAAQRAARGTGEVAPIVTRQLAPPSLRQLRDFLTEAERVRTLPLERTQRAMQRALPIGVAGSTVAGREYQRVNRLPTQR